MVKQRLNYVFKSQSMVVLIFLLFASAVSLCISGFTFGDWRLFVYKTPFGISQCALFIKCSYLYDTGIFKGVFCGIGYCSIPTG